MAMATRGFSGTGSMPTVPTLISIDHCPESTRHKCSLAGHGMKWRTHVTFRWKDYRESGGHQRKVMRITIAEFIRRFLLHVLPNGFHRIRHYGLLANGHRADKLTVCRSLLDVPSAAVDRNNDDGNTDTGASNHEPPPCPCCGRRLRIIESAVPAVSRPQARRLVTRDSP
jgi:hypothetical protein